MTVDARPLAASLATRSDEDLASLFAQRKVSPDSTWNDFFDVAEALLELGSLRIGLAALPADQAAALASAAARGGAVAEPYTADLQQRGLADASGRPVQAVGPIIDGLPAPQPPERQEHTVSDSPAAAERASTTVAATAELLLLASHAPLQQIGSGALSAHERKRLSDGSAAIAEPDDLDDVSAIAEAAGLLRSEDRQWMMTRAATDWLAAPTPERWRSLATAHIATIPDGADPQDPQGWAQAYPWDQHWPERAAALHRRSLLLGLTDAAGNPTPWALGDTEALTAHLPTAVNRVYLQNDLTAIAPGPLEPAADLRLRRAAIRESHAQASSYRFTPESVQRAIATGETEQSLTSFLTELSLTGIPQPLAYLVSAAARRYGEIVVRQDSTTGRTMIVADAALRQQLLVDHTLRPLALVSAGDVLTSRVSRDVVALALADARYPVSVVDAAGMPEPLVPGRLASIPQHEGESRYRALIARLRSATSPDQDAAWLQRELEDAVRRRAVIEVVVSLPDGERTLTMEAAGLGGGRLRGRDRAADVERTLPVSHISRIRIVE